LVQFFAETLLRRLPADLADELRGSSELSEQLDALLRTGRAAHEDVPVADEMWLQHFVRHLRPGEIVVQIAEMRAGDVHLALACLDGVRVAHAQLDLRVRAIARQALAGIRLEQVSADDAIQTLLEKLLVATTGPGKLAGYSGRGPLDGWLRVALARTALDMVRTRRTPDTATFEESEALLNLAATNDPRLEALRATCGPALKRAIEAGVALLPIEDRALLRLSVVDGLSIDDLAGIYRAHRATMARRLARAKNAILEHSRAHAMDALGVGEAEFASLMGVMLSGLDVTFHRLLEERPDGGG
jgi:RNA polymerase sigma-70 factor, ECF subfamily